MKSVLIGSLFILSCIGCATLPEKVEENIHIGDGYSQIKDAIDIQYVLEQTGEHSANMIYSSNADICTILLENGYVVGTECRENPSKKTLHIGKALGILLQGAGQGLMHAQDNSYSCTDWGNGYYTCSNQGRSYNCSTLGNTIQCH